MRIFISYAWEDVETAEGLATALRSDGHQVFFDRSIGRGRGLGAGAPIEKTIREQIWACHIFLFLASTEALERGSYARAEMSIAQTDPRRSGRLTLPVQVRPVNSDFPAFLRVGLLKPEGNLIAEVCAEIASRVRRKRTRRRRNGLLAIITVICLASIAIAAVYLFGQKPDVFAQLKTTEAVSEAEASFRQNAAAAGYSDMEVIDSWLGDFMIEHAVERTRLISFLRRKADLNEKGNLLIGVWHPNAAGSQQHTWSASASVGEAGTRPQTVSPYAIIHSPGLEPKDGPHLFNTGGVSVVGWAVLVGVYANSFDEPLAQWICTNFAPQRAPIVDTRIPTQGSQFYTISGPSGCPPQRFLALANSTIPEAKILRASLGLQISASGAENNNSDIIFISINKNQDPKPLPVRAALIWVKSPK